MIKANMAHELMRRGNGEGTVHSFDRVSSVNCKQKTYALKRRWSQLTSVGLAYPNDDNQVTS
jgi:hypothetical protein